METGNETQVIVIAEAPVVGLVKPRLSPPLRPEEAALVSEAALAVVAAEQVARQIPASRFAATFAASAQRLENGLIEA
jgi:hypothetical protein